MITSPFLASGPIISVQYVTSWPMIIGPFLAVGSMISVLYIAGGPMITSLKQPKW